MSPETDAVMPAVELVNVHKSFRNGRDQVLKGINVKFPRGKLSYVLGPSGTGKSVTLKHILGLLKPDEGEIHVLGQNLADLLPQDLIEFRQKFGMVFQNSALFDDMTVFENVAFPLYEHTHWNEEKIVMEVNAVLEHLGFPKPYDKFPNEISGGMRKRVGIARAIVRRPEILLYDEPTTGLDPLTRKTVDALIEQIKSEFTLTSIVISHDIPAALHLADFLVFLDQGHVVFQGDREGFMRCQNERIRNFLKADIESYEVLSAAAKLSSP